MARRRAGLTTRRILSALAVVLVLAVAGAVSGLLPVRIVKVDSASMAPTLEAGDLVLVEPVGDRLERRQVVALRHPGTGELLVKRIVGLAGDRVRLDDGVLMVDDEPVCEPSIDPDRIDGIFSPTVTVPAGSVFVLGDDRRDSVDSRDFGPVPVADVIGLVDLRVWPSPGSLPADDCPT